MNRFKVILLAVVALFVVVAPAKAQSEDAVDVADTVNVYVNAPMLDKKAAPQQYRVKAVNIHGIKNIDHDILRSSAGLVVGDSIFLPSAFISQAVNRLWSQRLYSDIEVGATIEGDDVTLDLYMEERPRVFNWAFEGEGVSKSKKEDLTEELKLRRNSELSDYVIDKNSRLIKNYFAKKGYLNTEVSTRIENDTIRPQMVNVTFLIDRKEPVRIGEIVFEGNDSFTDKKLRGALKKTHQKSWNFFQSSKFKKDEYENDKVNLIDFYNAQGFRNASIVSDSIYDINEKRIGIKIKVAEGNRYYIRNVSWVGNSVYQTEQLQQMFGVNSGDVYDKKRMDKGLGVGKEANPEDMSILSLYQNEGYLMSQIEPAEVVVGADSIDLQLKVFEGKQFTINNVEISGNMRVDDEVIRRELYTRPGELYNRALLMQTIRMLGTMGHFNPEAITPDIRPVSNTEVDVNWALEETASDQINIAGGWGAGTFVGSVGLTLNNLATRDFFNKGAWRPYPMGQNQRLSITGQTNGTYYKAFSVSYTDPWLGGNKPNSFTISTHYSDQNNAYFVTQTPTQYFRTTGLAAGLGTRLSWPDPYFTFYTEASYERYDLKDWNSFVMSNGAANMLSLRFVLARSSVDQPFYPRRGTDFNLSLQITPPYSLFDGVDYADPTLSESDRYKWVEFHKWQMKMQWYQALSNDMKLVLMARAEMGYLGNYNRFKASPFQRFEVGGDGMSGYNLYGIDIISMRGYEDGALDPVNSNYSSGYNKYTMELRYPIILEPSSQIYVLGFMEAGNGFDTWKDFSPFNVKRSAGFGIRLYLPVVGMLGIDWGYGFDPAAGESKASGSQFHFVMGQQF